jgi:Ca-activated chloride channel homolog
MKNKLKIIFVHLIISCATILVFGQDLKIKMEFSVLDENEKFFMDLKSSDIELLQNKKSLSIASIEYKNKNPLQVVIMIDASASQERTLPDEKKAAKYFIDNVLIEGKDKVAIVKFTGLVSLEQDLTSDFKRAKEQIEKIEFEPPPGYVGGGIVASNIPPKNSPVLAQGSTSIWDTVKQVSDVAAKVNISNYHKAIILISDGVNTYGDVKLKEAIETSIKNKIPVYAIGIGDDYYGGIDKGALKKITEQSSGISIIPKKKMEDLPQQLKKIEQALRFAYEITFSPNSASPRNSLQEAEIKIVNEELRKRKLKIIQPKGFFFPN